MKRFSKTPVAVVAALLVVATPLLAGEVRYQSSTGGQVFLLDEPCPANQFEFETAIVLPTVFPDPGDGRNNSVQCKVTAGLEGQTVRRGVNAVLSGELINVDTGETVRGLRTKTNALNPFARFSWAAVAALGARLAAVITGRLTGSALIDNVIAACRWQSLEPCQRDQDTACLFGNGRFQVEVDWRDFSGATGDGMIVRQNNREAEFWFFSPSRTELIVKLIDSCSEFDHFWVFAGGLTNVEVNLTVTDTQSGVVKSYDNPLGRPFQPIQDTAAFATCP